jgi:hypothetical protein
VNWITEARHAHEGDNLDRLKQEAADLSARLARVQERIRRMEDEQWREFQKQRTAALAHGVPGLDRSKT